MTWAGKLHFGRGVNRTSVFGKPLCCAKRLVAASALSLSVVCASCSSGVTAVSTPSTSGTAQVVFDQLKAAILSVSGTASDDVYAVGADPGDGLGPYVLHYDGAAWKRLVSGASGDLWWVSVNMIDGAFYMAGGEGKVLRYTPANGQFENLAVPGGPSLFGVWGSSSTDLWTVGGYLDDPDAGGVIARFDGQVWTELDLSGIAPDGLPTLYKVWGRGPADVYAVGRRGLILHFDGASWSRVSNDTERTLFTIHGNDSEVVATGGAGKAVIAELSAGKFMNRADVDTVQMNGVFIPPQGSGVTVGNQVSVAFQTAAGWELQDIGVDVARDLHAVWLDPDGGIWTVGGNLTASLDQGIVLYMGDEVISTNVRSD